MANDVAQYVIVADPRECLSLCYQASDIENVAMHHDLAGRVAGATEEYRRAAAKLREAAGVCPEGHPDERLLRQHMRELLARADYLECLDGTVTMKPLEEHIHHIQLTLGVPELLPKESAAAPWPSWGRRREHVKVMGAAAAISGATGFLMLGPLTGVALGVATALATTREDQAGSAARTVGDVGVQLLDTATRFDRQHRISHHVAAVGSTALTSARVLCSST